MSTVEQLICAVLRGENPAWPEHGDDPFINSFLKRSAYHGVQALLHQSLANCRAAELGWPNVVLQACRNAALSQAVWEMRHQNLLREVLARLGESGIQPLLFKGTALAYSDYAFPFLRTRGDTDLIIPFEMRDQACTALESLGFNCELGIRGDLVSYTAVYSLREPSGWLHDLDLHWRISNWQALSQLFSYCELAEEAIRLPALSPAALSVGRVHAVLLACMHRASHRNAPFFVDGVLYVGGDRLIWLYDIDLLLRKFTPSQWEKLLEIADRKGLKGVCLTAIKETCACFHSPVPEMACETLARRGGGEEASRFLNGSPMYQYYMNFLAVDGVQNKLKLGARILFPPEKYMRYVYSQTKPDWLPWLYARRIAIETFNRIYRSMM